MVFHLTRTFVGPTMEGVNDTVKTLLDHILSERAVAKCDLKHTVDVVPEALVLPEFCQDGRHCSKGMLRPT
jgi:hypothetical protein